MSLGNAYFKLIMHGGSSKVGRAMRIAHKLGNKAFPTLVGCKCPCHNKAICDDCMGHIYDEAVRDKVRKQPVSAVRAA